MKPCFGEVSPCCQGGASILLKASVGEPLSLGQNLGAFPLGTKDILTPRPQIPWQVPFF